MQRSGLLVALAIFAAGPLLAQRTTAFELGAFLQYSKYDDTTRLKDGIGAGARLGAYVLKNFALEYEGDFTKTNSTRVGELTALNHRFDGIFYFPLGDKLRLLAGGGWTGTQYHTDTTKNQYDSGGNAVVGLKYCLSENWTWRGDVNADFKDPSDQIPDGARTRTYNFRFGFGRFIGGKAKNSPCYEAPPPPPPAPAPAPAPAPPPPPPPAPAPAAEPAPPPPPPPAPPKARELFKLEGVHFAFDKYNLTAAAKDTLQHAVRFLKANPAVRVEIQGHTDWIGTDEYNQGLSERRANSVLTFLRGEGIDASRMQTKGFSESQPVADNATADGRAMNRRVVIIELP